MKSSGEHRYSEHVHKAGEAFDSLQEAEAKQKELEAELRAATQKRLHTQDQASLDELSRDIARLNDQILFFEGEKARLAAEVGEHTDKHLKGEELLEHTETKHIN